MKKSNFVKVALTVALTAALTVFTSCGESSTAKKVEVKTSSIPASGAKSFITSELTLTNFFKNIDDEIDLDKIEEEASKIFDIDAMEVKLASIENSSYLTILQGIFTKAEEMFTTCLSELQEKGKFNFNLSEKPGAAKDLEKGLVLNIPEITAKLNASVDDINNPSKITGTADVKVAANAALDDIKVDIKNISLKGNANVTSSDAISFSGDLNLDQKLSVSAEKNGLKVYFNNFDTNITGNGTLDLDKEKGSVKAKCIANLDAGIEFDAAKFGIPSLPIKYLNLKISSKGTVDAAPSITDNGLNGSANYDATDSISLGISFAGKSGIGGKAILNFNSSAKSSILLNKYTDLDDVLEEYAEIGYLLFDNNKLSEDEFNALRFPTVMSFSVKFYDDNDKETFVLADVKNLYEAYSYTYDLLKTADLDFDDVLYFVEDLFENLEDFVEDAVDSITGNYSYYDDYDDFDYDDWYDSYDYDDYNW